MDKRKNAFFAVIVLASLAALSQAADAAGIGEVLAARQVMTGNITNGLLTINSTAPGSPVGPIGIRNKGDAGLKIQLTPSDNLKDKMKLSETNFTLMPNEVRYINFLIFIIQTSFIQGEVRVAFSHVNGQCCTTTLGSELIIFAQGNSTSPPPNVSNLLKTSNISSGLPGSGSDSQGNSTNANLTALQQQIDALQQRMNQLENRLGFFENLVSTIFNGICSVFAMPFCPEGSGGVQPPAGGGNATTCQDECSASQATCSGQNARRVCGNFDSDSCLEYGPAVSCSTGQVCQGGQCVQQQCTMQNVCQEQSCSTITSYTTCRNSQGCTWAFFQNKCSGTRTVCGLQEVCS